MNAHRHKHHNTRLEGATKIDFYFACKKPKRIKKNERILYLVASSAA